MSHEGCAAARPLVRGPELPGALGLTDPVVVSVEKRGVVLCTPWLFMQNGELPTRDDFSIVFLFRLHVYKFKKTHKSVSPLTGRFLPRGGPWNVVFPSFVRCHWRRWSCGLAQPQHTLRLDVLGAKGILLPWAEFK